MAMPRSASAEMDEMDHSIMRSRIEKWAAISGPRVGDFCLMPDGAMQRFAYDHGDRMQPSSEPGSFYFGDGFMDYSGGLDSSIMKSEIRDSGQLMDGLAWFFHHDHQRAHNAVHCMVPCRVFSISDRVVHYRLLKFVTQKLAA